MTFSIVARSVDGAEWGVAVASKFLAVGSAVPAARAGVGALATQSYANTSYKPRGLALLADGHDADETLRRLLADDKGREHRQVGIVDADGKAATFTGEDCYDWAGGVTGDGVAVQGNILTGPEVVHAMQTAWEASETSAPLSRRLLTALLAGDAVGGDSRGRQSATLLVVQEAGGYAGFDDVLVDLRVDDHPDPCDELARLLDVHGLYYDQPKPEDRVPLDDELRAEVDELARRLGKTDFDAWVAAENFENRAWPEAVDRKVLTILRAQADGA
ncbi:MAG: DUF1028 domain-containing protein [Propionibacteriales bacterium]|nr:DUF1028 domain-containing protein [Propionibacteriales bacterium]